MLYAAAQPESDIAIRLEELLRVDRLLDTIELDRAKMAARAADKRLDQALVELGLLAQERLDNLLGTQLGIDDADPADCPAEPLCADDLAPGYLAAAHAVPWASNERVLVLAMCDPFDDFTARAVALKTGSMVARVRLAHADFSRLFAQLYGEGWLAEAQSVEEADDDLAETADVEVLRDAASEAPVVRFVQTMIRDAVAKGASDIHLRPGERGPELQFRVLGRLVAQTPPDPRLLPSIVSRLKVLAGLDISERRLPQDGRIRTTAGGRPIDVRLATMPHVRGEAAVLRILRAEIAASTIADLGFSATLERRLAELFGATEGLILVTGPTGSGKTTTLHAGLRQLVRPDLNIVTVEDPVEYRLDGAGQVQVDEKIGLDFAKVLRSLLRQDPDVILIGEMRDAETARIAVQSALTGHLVLATLHTNSSLAAIPRLIDMGVEPYLLPAVVKGVLSQRLARRLCPGCSVPAPSGRARGLGCETCGHSGYLGRIAIGEIAVLDSEITAALCAGPSLTSPLAQRLQSRGYRPLREDALERVANGEIELSETGVLAND
jgi:general secretion pathway protein E